MQHAKLQNHDMEVLGLSLFPPREKHIVRVRRSSVRDRYHRQLTSVFFLVPVSSMPPAPPTNWNTVTTSKPKPEKPQLRSFTVFQMVHTGNKTGIWQWSVWTTCLKLSLPGWEIFRPKTARRVAIRQQKQRPEPFAPTIKYRYHWLIDQISLCLLPLPSLPRFYRSVWREDKSVRADRAFMAGSWRRWRRGRRRGWRRGWWWRGWWRGWDAGGTVLGRGGLQPEQRIYVKKHLAESAACKQELNVYFAKTNT